MLHSLQVVRVEWANLSIKRKKTKTETERKREIRLSDWTGWVHGRLVGYANLSRAGMRGRPEVAQYAALFDTRSLSAATSTTVLTKVSMICDFELCLLRRV